MNESQEIEDDVAELVECFAFSISQGSDITDAAKQQFRDALNKVIDERIQAALAQSSSFAVGRRFDNEAAK